MGEKRGWKGGFEVGWKAIRRKLMRWGFPLNWRVSASRRAVLPALFLPVTTLKPLLNSIS